MFVDEVDITLTAGKGGNGAISWRREANIPKGWPWGWDGGKWGDIILLTDPNQNTLSTFRYKKIYESPKWQPGSSSNMAWAAGEDLILKVPVGTLVKDRDGEILHDLSTPHVSLRMCRWWRWWYGNAHFTSSTRQKPNFAELGDRGETIDVTLELKLVADIGIIGLPSAGKSTLISCVTNARPKIADYPFTTLTPNLGIMEHKDHSMVLEDVPGLIPGAHKGDGLGIQFLKHIQRTRVLLHLLDASRAEQCMSDYQAIRDELLLFDPDMAEKEEIIVLSKIDLISDHDLETLQEMMENELPDKKIFGISAPIERWLEELKNFLIQMKDDQAVPEDEGQKLPVINLREYAEPNAFTIEDLGEFQYRVHGDRIQQIVRMSDPGNSEATMRIFDVMKKRNILHEIEKLAKKTFQSQHPEHTLQEGEIWYHIGDEARALIEDRDFSLNSVMYMKADV